ncbi:MAG TPA: adenylate/guanylate cyclase domain-containing protein [Cyclobacteriaceae bacterium]|nr:adenylate/guanylate cyclase domain-containing protein [Cyclobacteriaceae bacterium]
MNNSTILIVDDTPENIDILISLLSEFRKKVATNGKKAVQLALDADPPDLILLDIDMPEMSGFEVCRILKENPQSRNIPIIFLTAQTDKKTTVEGFKLGASDFMTKPFNTEELMVRVKTQLDLRETRRRLESTIQQMETTAIMLKHSSEEMARQKDQIESAKKKVDELLINVLPEDIAKELREKGHVVPRHIPVASVLFADLVGFSRLCKGLTPKEIVDELNYLFVGFDLILENNNLEKIKTIGDGYMAAGGVPLPNTSNAQDAVTAALQMIQSVEKIRKENAKNGKPLWEIRIGIHTGELVAGVIGKNKFAYDIWGSAVNTAARMEAAGEPGKVNISGITYQFVKDKFACTYRGNIEVKNMGKLDMYFVSMD